MKYLSIILVFFIAGCGDNTQGKSPTPITTETVSHYNTNQRATSAPLARKILDGDATIIVNVTELPGRRIQLDGMTNLPTKTSLMLSVEERMQGGFLGQSECSVASDGSFKSEIFGPISGLKKGL